MPEKTNQDADINKISNTSIKESKMVTMNLERLEPCKTKIYPKIQDHNAHRKNHLELVNSVTSNMLMRLD